MFGSARTKQWPAFAEAPAFDNMATIQAITCFFQLVKIKHSKKLKLCNVMQKDAKLTWSISCWP